MLRPARVHQRVPKPGRQEEKPKGREGSGEAKAAEGPSGWPRPRELRGIQSLGLGRRERWCRLGRLRPALDPSTLYSSSPSPASSRAMLPELLQEKPQRPQRGGKASGSLPLLKIPANVHFGFFFRFLTSNLYAQCGARTHNPEIKSRTLPSVL